MYLLKEEYDYLMGLLCNQEATPTNVSVYSVLRNIEVVEPSEDSSRIRV